jgi:hypothetical protein
MAAGVGGRYPSELWGVPPNNSISSGIKQPRAINFEIALEERIDRAQQGDVQCVLRSNKAPIDRS